MDTLHLLTLRPGAAGTGQRAADTDPALRGLPQPHLGTQRNEPTCTRGHLAAMSPASQPQAQSLRSQTGNGVRSATSEPLVQKAGAVPQCHLHQRPGRWRPLLGSKATGQRPLHGDTRGTSQAWHFHQRRQAPPSAGRRPLRCCDPRGSVTWKQPRSVSAVSLRSEEPAGSEKRAAGAQVPLPPGPQGTGERAGTVSPHRGSAPCPTPLDSLSVLGLCPCAVCPF